MADIAKPTNPDDDYKFWMVVNPSEWLMPILLFVFAVAIVIHLYVYSLPGFGYEF